MSPPPATRPSGKERLPKLEELTWEELTLEIGRTLYEERQRRQAAIVSEARKYVDSSAWAHWADRPPYPAGTNKCNLFVYEVLKSAGTPVPMRVRWSWRNLGNVSYPPLARQWADPDQVIPGWVIVKDPQPGDVAAMRINYTDATGHVGIVTGPGTTVSASSETDTVVENDWGFRPGQKDAVVFRRYVGVTPSPVPRQWPTRGRIAP